MASTDRIIELSSLIAKETAVINDFLVQNQLPTPSLDAHALKSIPIPEDATEVQAARSAVIEACSELKALMTGPKELLKFDWTAFVSVKAVLRFQLDKSFPVGESTTFEAMSQFSGLSVRNVRRIVRHAIINHYFFQEAQPGIITHSGLTAVLAEDEAVRNSLIVELDEFWPAGVKMTDALEKWPNSEENNETPVHADVYFFRSIFHNWADKYCIQILQNLVPALKPGARVVIHERILPGLEGLNTVDARRAINLDIGMQQLLNAQQREMHEWPELFRKADSRFRYIGANKPAGATRWIIEAEWEG
ncbi:hypothetical protein Hte_008892 [Hypoxylon texense]